MVSELDKISMEVTLKSISQNSTIASGVSYGDSFSIGDLDARLIDTLGNPEKLVV